MEFPKEKKIILFDCVCNLCNDSVIKVIKHDKKNIFLFTALQSDAGQKILKEIGIDTAEMDSVILYIPNKAYYKKSSAALRIMNEFGSSWKLTQVFRILPAAFNDFFYDIISRNRYKWFGKKESCMIPTPELEAKFLD